VEGGRTVVRLAEMVWVDKKWRMSTDGNVVVVDLRVSRARLLAILIEFVTVGM